MDTNIKSFLRLRMDILEQYEKQNPETLSRSNKYDISREFQEESFLVRFVMRLSGGRIQDARQACFVLLGVAGVLFILAFIIVWPREIRRIPTAEDIRLMPRYDTTSSYDKTSPLDF